MSRRDAVGRRYFVCSFLYALWGIGFAFGISDFISYNEAIMHFRLSNAAAAFIPTAWLHFCLVYTNQKINRMYIFLIYLVPFIVLLNLMSPDFIPFVRPILDFKYYATAGFYFYLEFALYYVFVPVAFIYLFNHLKKTSGDEKKKLIGFILVSLSGYIGGGLTFFPVFDFAIPQYGIFLLPLYPFGLAYFISTKGLFDMKDIATAAHRDKLAALGILTASINHEIRSPLFVMRGAMETSSNLDQAKERVLPQIDRITGIVSRLTHFAKKGVEEEAKIEPIDLREVLADIRPLFQHQLSYQHIEYVQDIPSNLPKLMADRRYLEEILFNLILNGCQALRETENPKIDLKASSPPLSSQRKLGSRIPNQVSNDRVVIIEILDNGPGMTPEALKNIFKPFNTTKQEGTGLGLYITKQLVEKCGGKIEVNSKNGTKFIVSLRLKEKE